jgi:hypothetical protein
MFSLNPAEQQTLFLQSFRYALGRRTYAVQDTADTIKKFWPQLDPRTKLLIERDLTEAITNDQQARDAGIKHHPLGMDMDRETWLDLASFIESQADEYFSKPTTGAEK